MALALPGPLAGAYKQGPRDHRRGLASLLVWRSGDEASVGGRGRHLCDGGSGPCLRLV